MILLDNNTNKGNILNKPLPLFIFTFVAIIATYLFVLGENKTIEIIKNELHISEYSDSNVGVQPDTFAMRFSSL